MNYIATAFRSSATERPFMPSNKEQPDVSISSLELGLSGLLLDQSMYVRNVFETCLAFHISKIK